VDDAFNAAAVELAGDQTFHTVLHLTERAHANLFQLLGQYPASDYRLDGHLCRRMVLILEHHAEHRVHLEAQLVQASGGVPALL
jgi:hypothetical protein